MKKILIVDDQKEFLLLLGTWLQNEDIRIIAATTGKGAITLAKAEHPDTILLDIVLPDMDGREVAKEIRKDPDTKDIPIIFISGLFSEEEAEKKGHEFDGEIFLAKSGDMKKLVEEIRKRI